ncbi:hypothetical protein ACLB2K_020208 [Fragaria x ananassa]
MKLAGTIVVKVVPPNNEGDGGNQFEQVNEPIVQAGAQPLAANVVAQPAAANGVVRPEDIQGIYDRALQQLRTEFRTELRDTGVNLTYQTPYLDYVAGADWPQNYRNIHFTPFSGEGSEDAATYISRFQIEPEVDLSSLTSMYQQPMESPVEFLKRFKVQHAKCRSPISEEDVVHIAIKGLEPRQQLKHHVGQFSSMADLMNKVGSYQIVLNDMDERQNACSGTYVPGTLKPRYVPNRHKTVGAIYSHVDPYYPASVARRYNMDYDDEEEVATLELVSKKPARENEDKTVSLVDITYDTYVKLKDQIQVWINEGVVTLDEEKTVSLVDENPFPTLAMVDVVPAPRNKAKSKYEFYTYNADLAHVLLDELIQANLLNIPWGGIHFRRAVGRCKVECGIPVSYNEFEIAVKAVEAKDKCSPLDHYQPASPTKSLKQADVRFRFRESNLYKGTAKAGTSTVGPIPEVQKDILTKPYIPPASRNIIKDDTWTIDRLTVKPYAPLKRNKEAVPLAPPRESALKRLYSTPGSPKRKSVLEILGLIPVDKFTPSTSGIKAVATELEAKRIKSDLTPKKGQVKERVPEAKNDNTMDTSLVTAMVQTFAEIDATLVVQIAASEPKLAMDKDVSTNEEEGDARVHCNMVYVISSKYALPKLRAVCSVTKTQEVVNEVASEMEKVTIDSIAGSSEGVPLGITDAMREWHMMFLRPSPSMMEHLRPIYVTADMYGTKVSKILVDARAAGFFVTDCTAPYSYILGRDWIHKAACIPSLMHQELLMWDQTTGHTKLVKVDLKPSLRQFCLQTTGNAHHLITFLRVVYRAAI